MVRGHLIIHLETESRCTGQSVVCGQRAYRHHVIQQCNIFVIGVDTNGDVGGGFVADVDNLRSHAHCLPEFGKSIEIVIHVRGILFGH